MTRKPLSRSVEEFFRAGGWSAYRFVPHARHVLVNLPEGVAVEVGRTVIHLVGPTRTLRVYVHHNGRSAEYATFTDDRGRELESFHFTIPPEQIARRVREWFEAGK
jgi:hypothetical protein